MRAYEAVFKAAADPSRARILKMLECGELCVCQIQAVLGLSQSTTSKHLSVLRAAGLLDERKEGRWVHYRLAEDAANPYALPLLKLLRGWLADDPTIQRDRQRLCQVLSVPLNELCPRPVRNWDERPHQQLTMEEKGFSHA
jgi:DNA-binding transcriptional ArsR family regulator